MEIVLAAGCFWGAEKHFADLEGVIDVTSGYAGGNYENPTYDDVLNFRTLPSDSKIINHTEVVQVRYDENKIGTLKIIKSFWELHDPTQLNRQGHDVGNNYRSALFYTNDSQKKIALETKEIYQKLLNHKGFGKIVTEIKKLGRFYPAENYHQDYLKNNPNGYCPNHSTGVKFSQINPKQEFIAPLGGKEILIVEADGFCPYCKKFKKDVVSSYQGSVPLRAIFAKNLKNFVITTKLDASPIIIFIEDGKELFSHKGYMDSALFYKTLGDFVLGRKSESYQVAFNASTDNRFCQQYDLFKNTTDGVFVDKLSGRALFDTKDRFNSGTGWLSFLDSHHKCNT